MSKIRKIALLLIAAGGILVLGALVMAGFHMERFNTVDFQPVSYDLEGDFQSIQIDVTECDVTLVYTPGQCRVETVDSQWIKTQVDASGGTLTVTRRNTTPWWRNIGIWWNGPGAKLAVTVYLPQSWYEQVDIRTVSGDIDIPDDFSVGQLLAKTTSGDITTQAGVSDGLDIQSVSGDIAASSASGPVRAESTSGQILLEGVSAEALTVTTVSGDIRLEGVTAAGTVVLKTTSGDIRLAAFDGAQMEIKTVSGNVTGTVLSPKNFQTKTTSGDISVSPHDPAAGLCQVETISGDVHIELWR